MELKTFSSSEKLYRKPDGQGMYLEVRPNGSKLWFLKYRIDGKEKRLGLGSAPPSLRCFFEENHRETIKRR